MRKALWQGGLMHEGILEGRVLWLKRALWKIGQMYDCIIKGKGNT